jgi:ribosomal-protein-alanine N-acetyltransferase
LTDQQIRPATLNDLHAISHIEDESFPNPYPRILIERLIRDNADTFLVAVDHSKKVMGYCIVSVDGTFAHLISIAVKQNNRRKGIATALLKEQLAYLEEHDVREIWLEVSAKNTDAIDLYLKLGFTAAETIQSYYSDGSAALRMRIILTEETERLIEKGPS